MKIVVVLLIVVAVVGSAFGDDQGGGVCPIENEAPVDTIQMQQTAKCLVSRYDGNGPNIDFLSRPDATDLAREFFKDYCEDLEPVKRCLDEVNDVWKKCHNKDERKDFELLRDLLETSLEVFCAENGEKLVKVYQELQPNPAHRDDHVGLFAFMEDCMREVDLNFLGGDERLSERIFVGYRRVKFLRKCLVNNSKDVFLSTNEISSLVGKVFHKMKCLHPVRKTFVLCSTLNDDGTGDMECPPWYENVDEKHTSQELIDRGFQCFFSPIDINGNQLPRDVLENETGEYFVNYCKNLTEVHDCLAEVTQFARLCLNNKTRHKVFEIFQDMLTTSLEIACSEDGVVLTTIFFGNFDRSGGSGEYRDVVGECKDVSVTRIKHVPDLETEDATTMSLRMYQEVAAFEECLTRDVKEDTFKTVAHTFINDVMNKIRCVHPIGQESVRCKSIIDGF